MSNRILYIIISIAIFFGIVAFVVNYFTTSVQAPTVLPPVATTTDQVFCTEDALQCPDGLFVGRTGPKCEFVCPTPSVPLDIQKEIDKKADLIRVSNPAGMSTISSPLSLSGQARGNWFFEASAPVTLVNWDGLIIAEGFVTATGDWMTTEFVPFTGTLNFTSPYKVGNQDFMKRGTLIFKKDNPSGLPENDDALEIPVLFTN